MARVKLPDGRIVNADSVDKLIGLKKTTSFKKSDSRSVRATAASKSHSLSSIKSAKKTQSALLKYRKSHADEHHTAGSDCLSRSNRRGESHKGQHLNQWSETKVNDTAMIMIDSTADTELPTMPDSGPVKKSISFDEILQLPKRQRPIAKFQRQKPPSFELTGNDTMQFVRDRIVKKKEPESKSRRKKDVNVNEKPATTETNSESRSKRGGPAKKDGIAKERNSSKQKNESTSKRETKKDIVPCGVCKIRCCDEKPRRSWIQCQECQLWYHYECQGLEEKCHIQTFICIGCD